MAPRFMTAIALVALLGTCAALGCARPATRHGSPVPPGTSQASTPSPVPAPAARLATAPPVADLGNVEVRSYKGTRLDLVSSEPENSIKGPQHVDIETYRLAVTGSVTTPLSLTYADVTEMPAYQKATTLNCVDGWSVTYLWQGVLIKDLLARADADARDPSQDRHLPMRRRLLRVAAVSTTWSAATSCWRIA